jgi:hypothetical protein
MRVIYITDELSNDQYEKLAMIVGMVANAMVDKYWGSFEFKMENGNPLPHVPAKESRVLFERSSNGTKETRKTKSRSYQKS